MTWRDGGIDVAAAGSPYTLRFDRVDALQVLHAFAVPRTLDQAVRALPTWTSADVIACAGELREARALITSAEFTPPPQSWDRWSLAFHHSSRSAHFKPRYGHRTPAVAPIRSLRRLPLAPPPAQSVQQTPRTLTELLGTRRSVRSWPAESVPFAAFSDFLWRSARNRGADEQVSRPYPSGGGVYSLELYTVITDRAVEAVPGGLYRYVPEAHALELMSADVPSCEPFLDAAAHSAGSERPPVLLVITSRYARR